MCYYDHATQLALGLDRWDLARENRTGDAELTRAIRAGKLKPKRTKPWLSARLRSLKLRFWRNGLSLP